ncbi:glycosyltransferase [uncultured Polaribacter sp.]|uniref:glycosyltransferase n=1 Tax=uncultured Polaribacter sp. TaxID=174711 RepID=UPI002625CD65|nr:glycosyltransferase [uncultured Polaribacter sp.]
MKKANNKILIIGPFAEFGGRELMSVFIADCLSKDHSVDICSTGNMSKKAVINKNFKQGTVFSLKKNLFKKNFIFRFFAYLSYFKNNLKKEPYFYLNNKINKSLGSNRKYIKELDLILKKYQLVFINAQFSSNYVDYILKTTKTLQIPTIFRTTGTINPNDYFQSLENVDMFIHHSISNSNKIKKNNFEVIDQASFIEKKLITIKPKNKIKNFLFLGRLVKEKGIDDLIKFFIKYPKDDIKLNIVGDGPLKKELLAKYSNQDKIFFLNFLAQEELHVEYQKNDCLIIASHYESGPLVGVEAMASGNIIISTKVGAMEERLKETKNNFWFDINNYSSFEKCMNIVLNLNSNEIKIISESLKEKYIKSHKLELIQKLYKETVRKVLNK